MSSSGSWCFSIMWKQTNEWEIKDTLQDNLFHTFSLCMCAYVYIHAYIHIYGYIYIYMVDWVSSQTEAPVT